MSFFCIQFRLRIELQVANGGQQWQNTRSHPLSLTWNPRMPARCYRLTLTQNSWFSHRQWSKLKLTRRETVVSVSRAWLEFYSRKCIIMSCWNTSVATYTAQSNLYNPLGIEWQFLVFCKKYINIWIRREGGVCIINHFCYWGWDCEILGDWKVSLWIQFWGKNHPIQLSSLSFLFFLFCFCTFQS